MAKISKKRKEAFAKFDKSKVYIPLPKLFRS